LSQIEIALPQELFTYCEAEGVDEEAVNESASIASAWLSIVLHPRRITVLTEFSDNLLN